MVKDCEGMVKTRQKVTYKQVRFQNKDGDWCRMQVRSVTRVTTHVHNGKEYVPVDSKQERTKDLLKKYPGVQMPTKKKACPWL